MSEATRARATWGWPWRWSTRGKKTMVLVVLALAFVDTAKGPFFIGRWPFEFWAILGLLLLLVSPQAWRDIARRAPPWRGPHPVLRTLSSLFPVVAFAVLIVSPHFRGRTFAFMALLAASNMASIVADLISPRPSRWAVLFGALLLVAWLALLVEASQLPW